MNKMKIIKTIITTSILFLVITNTAFASWWNPFTWSFFKKQNQKIENGIVLKENKTENTSSSSLLATEVNKQKDLHEENKVTHSGNNTIDVVTPKKGDVLSPNEKVVVKWNISKELLESFPKDFNVNLFLYVKRHGVEGEDYVTVANIGDGNNARVLSTVWDISNTLKYNKDFKEGGVYKIVAELQAIPKDKTRLCAVVEGNDCSMSKSDLVISAKASGVKGESEWFSVGEKEIVPGMTKYIDTDFGFSFWHPIGSKVDASLVENVNAEMEFGKNTKVLKQIKTDAITILEVYSPDMSIYGDNGVGPGPLSSYLNYFFDKNKHQWMVATDKSPRGDPPATTTADISKNTMGGLHIFYGYERFGIKKIIPLSAHNFLVIYANCSEASEHECGFGKGSVWDKFERTIKTIVALDPSVATPRNYLDQREIVRVEARTYHVENDIPLHIPGVVQLARGGIGISYYGKDAGNMDSYMSIELDKIGVNSVDVNIIHREILCVLCDLGEFKSEENVIHLTLEKPVIYREDTALMLQKIENKVAHILIYNNRNIAKLVQNSKYQYQMNFPRDWVVSKEKSIIDDVNKIASLVTVYSLNQDQKVSIIVNQNESLIKNSAIKTEIIKINGENRTVYMFPEGYECHMRNPNKKDCSFFIIPIYHNGYWYEIKAEGKAESVSDLYREILSTFKFIP